MIASLIFGEPPLALWFGVQFTETRYSYLGRFDNFKLAASMKFFDGPVCREYQATASGQRKCLPTPWIRLVWFEAVCRTQNPALPFESCNDQLMAFEALDHGSSEKQSLEAMRSLCEQLPYNLSSSALSSEQRKFLTHVYCVSNKAPQCLGTSDDMCSVRDGT